MKANNMSSTRPSCGISRRLLSLRPGVSGPLSAPLRILPPRAHGAGPDPVVRTEGSRQSSRSSRMLIDRRDRERHSPDSLPCRNEIALRKTTDRVHLWRRAADANTQLSLSQHLTASRALEPLHRSAKAKQTFKAADSRGT